MFSWMNCNGIPKLPKRNNNIEKFSTYIRLNSQNKHLVIQWEYQLYLKRNIELYEKMNKRFARLCRRQDQGLGLAEFWQHLVLNELQPPEDWEPANRRQLALEHLATYFEEKCYFAAKKVWKESKEPSWEEYLCIARLIIYDNLKLKELLEKYDSKAAKLDTYITQVLIKNIKHETDVGKFSCWRLLYKKSDKELKEALQRSGRNEPDISRFIFARKYFKQVYLVNKVKNPTRQTGKKWPEPDQEDFEKSAHCYNAEKLLPSAPHEVSASSSFVTGKQIQTWMEICITALQNYPKSITPCFSLEALQATGRETEFEEQQKALVLEWQEPGETEELGQEQRHLANQTDVTLRQQMTMLKPEHQKILLLYYGVGLSQKQLADRLGINQGTISRHLSKSTVILLNALIGLSQPHQWVKEYLAEWLEQDYPAPLHSDLVQAALVSAIKKLERGEREILQLRYGQHMDERKVANQLGINQTEVTETLQRVKHQLQESLLSVINIWIKMYIEKWLSSYYKSEIQSVLQTLEESVGTELELEKKINAVEEAYFQTLTPSN